MQKTKNKQLLSIANIYNLNQFSNASYRFQVTVYDPILFEQQQTLKQVHCALSDLPLSQTKRLILQGLVLVLTERNERHRHLVTVDMKLHALQLVVVIRSINAW